MATFTTVRPERMEEEAALEAEILVSQLIELNDASDFDNLSGFLVQYSRELSGMDEEGLLLDYFEQLCQEKELPSFDELKMAKAFQAFAKAKEEAANLIIEDLYVIRSQWA